MEGLLKNASPLSEVMYQNIFSPEILSRAKAVLLWKNQVETIKNVEVKRAYQAFFKERFYRNTFTSPRKSEVSCSVSSLLGIEILLGALCVFPRLCGEVQELLVQLHCPKPYASLKESLIQWGLRYIDSTPPEYPGD